MLFVRDVITMARYGDAAVLATSIVQIAKVSSPEEAWKLAVAKVCPDSVSSQKKGCPKGAYLGLCEEGLVKGIPAGSYTKSVHNKKYALRAVSLLRSEPSLSGSVKNLWDRVQDIDGEGKAPNGQIDVVLALWQKGLLRKI
jgi:hypothetical protein